MNQSFAEVVTDRAYAALENPTIMRRWVDHGGRVDGQNVTIGEVVVFASVTGLDARLLFSHTYDIDRGLDDLPRFNGDRTADVNEGGHRN